MPIKEAPLFYLMLHMGPKYDVVTAKLATMRKVVNFIGLNRKDRAGHVKCLQYLFKGCVIKNMLYLNLPPFLMPNFPDLALARAAPVPPPCNKPPPIRTC